jgi:SAM-dependent methyltransferase
MAVTSYFYFNCILTIINVLANCFDSKRFNCVNDTTGTTVCQLCGRTLQLRFREVLDPQTREVFEIRWCGTCRHGYTLPVPADMDRYYGPAYHGGRHSFTAEYCASRRLRIVTKAVGDPKQSGGRRLLDIGCGDGTFLLKAKRHGWNATGTEMNPEVAQKAGLDVYKSLEEVSRLAPFDCITLWHVLEHFKNPLDELKSIGASLDPQGVLVIAVPNAWGTQARFFGPKWFHLDVPRHLHHLSRQSLEQHLAKTGFSANRYWHGEFEYDLFGWSQSALNCLLSEPNTFFNILTGRTVSIGRFKRFSNLLLGGAFCGLALLPTWWGMMTGRAGTLIVAAKKHG